jgi:hypothetical protein
MPLSPPISIPPEQSPYCEPAQIRKGDNTGAETFYVPEKKQGKIMGLELDYYIDQNALPPPQAPAVPPQQPAPITLVIPGIKDEDDEPAIPDITKGKVITTLKPVLKIQPPAQAIQWHTNGRYDKVIRAHLSPHHFNF